jgi:hypothetical protein
MPPQRRAAPDYGHPFPPPWSVEEQEACFVVRDHDGQQLAYVYFEEGARDLTLLSPNQGRTNAHHRIVA